MSKLDKYIKQKGGSNTLYVDSKNDPRFKAYSDSLNLYNKTKLDVSKLKKANNYPEWMGLVDDLNQDKSVENSFLNLSKLNKREPSYKVKFSRTFDNDNTGVAGNFESPNQKVEILKRTEFPEITNLQSKYISLKEQAFPLGLEFEDSLNYGKYIGHDRIPGSEYKRNSNGTYGEYVDKYDRPAKIKWKGSILKQDGGKNVIHNGKPMYKRKDGEIVKRGLWSNSYLSKKQQGGSVVPQVILEKGEYYKDINGEVKKVSNKAPTHDEKYVIEGDSVNLTTKGKGGVLLDDVQSVLSNTYNNRSVNDESFQLTDALITLSKDEVEQMSTKFNLKFKPKKMSGSKFLDESTKQKNVVLNKYKNINYRNTELAANSLKANKAFISSLPSIEELYDEVFAKQESDKQGNTGLEEVAQTGAYKGIMNRYPSMNGRIPVGRTKNNNKPITMLNNRTISMDDVFSSDSVEVKDGKAHTFYNSKLKKYIKK